jgi:nucleoside phosphorylase
VQRSGLLTEAAISHGQMINDGHPFSVGRKDTPLHISQDGYIPRLKWISKKFVVLWDEECKRGWLINGTAALLHLVRASLGHDKNDHFNSAFLFNNTELTESPQPHKSHSAIQVLINRSNMRLKVYPNKDSYITFENRVEHFYEVLEKLVDHQVHAIDRYTGRGISRAYLEGWDFNDLATDRDPVYPRSARLDKMGKSWVDFTRSIHAIALLGRGFGEIIEPTGVFCPYWAKLPKDRSYLAACVSDLKEIMDDPSIPMQLTHNTIWHHVAQPFKPCRCQSPWEMMHQSPWEEIHSDLTQVLLPWATSRETLQSTLPTFTFTNAGAVIFGFNKDFKWYWGDTGNPSREQQEDKDGHGSKDTPSSPFHDSGVGNSLASYSSKGSDTKASSSSPEEWLEEPANVSQPGSKAPESTKVDTFATKDYKVGIMCALDIEFKAVRALFDQEHELKQAISGDDPNYYALGCMGKHNVVSTCLPAGEYGTNSAADVASNMKRTFRAVRFCLLVGIGGGVPSEQSDIRLGDVVVSEPTGTQPGVLQYDMGKALENGVFEQHGFLPPPPRHLRCAISGLRSDPRPLPMLLDPYLRQIEAGGDEYRYPGQENDKLAATECVHAMEQKSCCNGDSACEVMRAPRPSTHPRIHYGLIASGNRVMQDAKLRDQLGRKYNVLCFEMEAAGIMNTFPSLVIRGICDYADSRKNKRWQGYAAAAAAAYAKLLLSRIRLCHDSDLGFEMEGDHSRKRRQKTPELPQKRTRPARG